LPHDDSINWGYWKIDIMQLPVIHGFYNSAHDPIEKWVPENPTDVDVWIDVYIGPDNRVSGEFFVAHVATETALRRQGYKNYAGPRLTSYSWDLFDSWIKDIVLQCHGGDWLEMTDKLRRYLHWEYEGMR